ncbi:MAG: dynamin family protein [Veillonella sp.]|uniref:dynamin family protein n=1 Tax=Veillonella sp. TaxID=1926307 RepID=UPI002901D4F1|nr:dynamin family protein [Veillonella sp.]MDU2067377.1 dynamin family protein [Veillonella sp.]MDU3280967.1 dynamin family protein [Veillonella sp.]
MVISYKKKKEEVLSIYNDMENFLQEVLEYYKNINISNPLKRKEGLIKKIRADIAKIKEDKFKIIVAGEAKSGKSTFINAYLGIDLLPVDVKQCTSVLLEIKYAKNFKLVATYADGRIEVINEPEAVKSFLKKNASLDDDYRDIPVPTINEEILVKAGRKANNKTKKIKIFEEDIKNLIASESVQAANIYHLSLEKYESKIRQYISSYIDNWFNIVTKIEIFYPLSDSLKGVEIIDSPGVCARGGVSEVTTEYIKDANAIIFLKPITGQAIESTQFSQFMNNTIVGRNKEALFLIFTRVAQMNENDLMRLQEEAYKQFKQLNKENILFVDSKAEMSAKVFDSLESIEAVTNKLKELDDSKELEDFIKLSYYDTIGGLANGSLSDFIQSLEAKSRFKRVYSLLEKFGRKSHYILLKDVLNTMIRLYNSLDLEFSDQIESWRQKIKNPNDIEAKIKKLEAEKNLILNRIAVGIEDIRYHYTSNEKGKIKEVADTIVCNYKSKKASLNPDKEGSIDSLKSISLETIEECKEISKKIQQEVIEDCNDLLKSISEKLDLIDFIKPDYESIDFEKIEKQSKSNAEERVKIKEAGTFSDAKYASVFSQKKYFKNYSNSIDKRLNLIRAELENELIDFVSDAIIEYRFELNNNADSKIKELKEINEVRVENTEIMKYIEKIEELSSFSKGGQIKLKAIEKGIL